MALTNFTLPFGSLTSQNWAATVSPLQPHHVNAVNNLLYGPAGHQETEELPSAGGPQDYYKNNPYSPPQNHQYQFNSNTNNNSRRKGGNSYLPPTSSSQSIKGRNLGGGYDPPLQRQQPKQLLPQRGQQQFIRHNSQINSAPPTQSPPRTYDDGQYHPPPPTRASAQYFNGYNTQSRTYTAPVTSNQPQQTSGIGINTKNFVPSISSTINRSASVSGPSRNEQVGNNESSPTNSEVPASNDPYPERPPGFTRVKAGQGARTQVHAVLDYDVEEGEEDYYDDDDEGTPVSKDGKKSMPTVTPIQGPIFIKNGTVPVVPLFSYPTINNGTFVQIPIWWTALSVALGLDIQGDVIKGVPCVKRYHQLFCPTAGNSYPIDKIERFIDDNKALMRRMYGDFEMNPELGGPLQQTKRRRRYVDDPDIFIPPGAFPAVPPDDLEKEHNSEAGETYFGNLRKKRQTETHKNSPFTRAGASDPIGNIAASTGRMDACESKIEIVTPYWASNAAGKIRAIVNTQHFEQAIHQEICTKLQTNRCTSDCGCEQKYKWHRLLAYDPDNDCKGIFMDWFLFPSCCVCRCSP